jgi:hypothetical protein
MTNIVENANENNYMKNLNKALLLIDKLKKNGSDTDARLRNKKLSKIDSSQFIFGDLTDEIIDNTEPDKLYHCDGEYFYKSYNIINKSDQIDLIQEAELYLKSHRNSEEIDPHPPMVAFNFFTVELLKKKCWKNLIKSANKLANRYAKKYLNLNDNLLFHSCWINKVSHYTDEEIKNNLLFDIDFEAYTDNHVHIHSELQIVSCIFYLRNPDKKYGTLIETKNNFLVIDGTENSFSIFNPRLYHQALYPPREITSKYPRYSILIDFQK